MVWCDEDYDNCEYISAGKIIGGKVNLQLPTSIDAKYLDELWELWFLENAPPPTRCNIPANVKVSAVEFDVPQIDDGFLELGYYKEEDIGEKVHYLYSSGQAKISCDYEGVISEEGGGDAGPDGSGGSYYHNVKEGLISINLNLAQGWNEIYYAETDTSATYSTDKSVLKHQSEIKWILNGKGEF